MKSLVCKIGLAKTETSPKKQQNPFKIKEEEKEGERDIQLPMNRIWLKKYIKKVPTILGKVIGIGLDSTKWRYAKY